MKRFVAMLLALIMLGQLAMADDETEQLETYQPPEEELLAELSEYGSVQAAMDEYARKHLMSLRAYSESILAYDTMAFRMLVDKIEGEDDDPNYIMRFFLELGYAEAERDGDWAMRETQVALYLEKLLILAEMDDASFENVKSLAEQSMPERNVAEDAFKFTEKLLMYGAGRMLKLAKKDLQLDYNASVAVLDEQYAAGKLTFGQLDNYRTVYALEVAEVKNMLEAAEQVTDIASNTKEIGSLVISAIDGAKLKQVTNAYEKVNTGIRMLQCVAPVEYEDPDYYEAVKVLYETYLEFQEQLSALSADENGADKLDDAEYLDQLFHETLKGNLQIYGEDVMQVASMAGLELSADIWTGGLATVLFEGSLQLGEWFVGTKSTYAHMHGISALNEIYEELEERNEANPLASWMDYYAYAENIKRLCNVAMLGERHMYEMSVVDAGLYIKLWNKIGEALGRTSDMQNTEKWYQLRVQNLQNLHDRAQEYMSALLQHQSELLAVDAQMTPYLGHEDESEARLSGFVRQGEWYAKTDGSGEPDLSNPNPDKAAGASDVKVMLMADGEKIAEATTDLLGSYTLTYKRVQAEGKALTLQFAPKGNGKYAEKNVDAVRYVNITFPSSYGWDSENQTPEAAGTWSTTVQVPYSDWNFISPDSGTYSQELALSSLGLAAASMSRSTADGSVTGGAGRDANIRSALTQMGYTVVQTSNYDTNLNDVRDGVPFALGTKVVEDPNPQEGEKALHRIVVLAVGGDVDVPAMTRGWYDDELDESAGEISQSMLSCINSVWNEGTEQLHLWLTGFSWGGTVADGVLDKLRSDNLPARGTYDVELYTFGAFGDLSAQGNHLAYAQDLIALGLTEDSENQIVFENVSQESPAHNVVSSIYHELTYGNALYSPRWFETDTLLKDTLREIEADQDDLKNLLAAMVTWNFLNSADGTDFRMLEPADRSVAVRSLLGFDADWSDAQATAYAGMALDALDIPVLAATPENYSAIYKNILADVIVLDAALPKAESALILTEELQPYALQLLLQVDEALYNPASADSLAFAHHPEMYFAWLLGTSAESLTGEGEESVYHADLLPLPINLQGTVLDEKTRQPISGAKVTIAGDGITQVHTTDAQGEWGTYVDRADYRITFECSNYKTVTKDVSRTMFGDEAVILETLMVAELPYLTAYIDKRSTGPVQALTEDGECPAGVPEITLSMTIDGWNNADSITIVHEACAEPLTYYPVASNSARLFAVDMGNGSYTYVLNAYCNGTGGGSYVVVFRVVNGELVIIKELVSEDQRDNISVDATFPDDSTCVGTIYPTRIAFKVAEIPELNEDRTGKTLHDAGLGTMRAELREDGYYDLVFSLGTYCIGNYDSIGDVCTRYTMIDDELVMESQWIHPYEGVLVSDQSDEIEVCTVSKEDACYLYRARLPGETLYGYVDIRNGKFAIRPQFVSCDTTFSNNSVAIVYNELDQCNVINEKGEKLFEDGEIVTAMEFYDDHYLVVQRDTAHCYLYDADGNELMELKVPVADVAELWPTTVNLGWSSSIYGRWYRTYLAERYILLRAKDQSGVLTEHWLNEKGEVLLSTTEEKIPGSLAGDESGYYYFYDGKVDYFSPELQYIQSKSMIGEIPVVNWDGDKWYARGYHAVYTNGMRTFASIGLLAGSFNIDANDGVICTEGFYFSSDGTELNAPYLHGSASYYRNGYVKWEEGYGDASGNITFVFPDGTDSDDFSVVFRDGYYFQKEGALYGIRNIDGTVICEPTYSELGDMH